MRALYAKNTEESHKRSDECTHILKYPVMLNTKAAAALGHCKNLARNLVEAN